MLLTNAGVCFSLILLKTELRHHSWIFFPRQIVSDSIEFNPPFPFANFIKSLQTASYQIEWFKIIISNIEFSIEVQSIFIYMALPSKPLSEQQSYQATISFHRV